MMDAVLMRANGDKGLNKCCLNAKYLPFGIHHTGVKQKYKLYVVYTGTVG